MNAGGQVRKSERMPLPLQPSFSDLHDLAVVRQHQQMWQAAQTVRAHVGAGQQRDDLLSCLGLTDVLEPGVRPV